MRNPPNQFAQAQRAADLVISGAEPGIARGATRYYATTTPKPPTWAMGAKAHAQTRSSLSQLLQSVENVIKFATIPHSFG
ncbi:hypothetical protein AXG94_19270 [Pseudomonas corrugata]|nr:hypothetical protein AXG94_19270 [Pseudomonas corrugata]